MNDDKFKKIRNKIAKVHNKITPTGRLSTSRTDTLCGFLICAIWNGLEEEKKGMSDRVYKKYMNDLKKCGITEELINKESEREKAIEEFLKEYKIVLKN